MKTRPDGRNRALVRLFFATPARSHRPASLARHAIILFCENIFKVTFFACSKLITLLPSALLIYLVPIAVFFCLGSLHGRDRHLDGKKCRFKLTIIFLNEIKHKKKLFLSCIVFFGPLFLFVHLVWPLFARTRFLVFMTFFYVPKIYYFDKIVIGGKAISILFIV